MPNGIIVLNDPVNFVDPLGLDGAGRRIVTQGLIGAGRGAVTGAIVGTPVLGVGAGPSALAGGIVGFSLGLLQGVIFEALGWGEAIENFLNDLTENLLNGLVAGESDEPC